MSLVRIHNPLEMREGAWVKKWKMHRHCGFHSTQFTAAGHMSHSPLSQAGSLLSQRGLSCRWPYRQKELVP